MTDESSSTDKPNLGGDETIPHSDTGIALGHHPEEDTTVSSDPDNEDLNHFDVRAAGNQAEQTNDLAPQDAELRQSPTPNCPSPS